MPLLHQSKAVVGTGELLANFPLCLGKGVGSGVRYRGTVACLHAAAEEIEESAYKLSMSLQFEGGEECYSGYFQALFGPTMTPRKVYERLDEYNKKVEAFYPYLHNRPRIDFEQENGVQGHFVVSLPPFTSVYTATQGFWDTLGFEEDSYKQFPGVRMKHSAGTVVLAYGFTNRTADTLEIVSRETASDTATLNVVFAAVSDPTQGARTYLELRVFQDVLPLALAKKRPVNKTLVMDGLATVLDSGLRILGLDPTAVYIEASQKNLVFKSKEYHRLGTVNDPALVDAKVSVVVNFPSELQDYLKMDVEKLVFPLSDSRSYEVEPREEGSFDPLEEFYPVSLALQQGEAKNFVEGRGFTSLLGVMRSREDIVGEGAVFYGDCEQLTVRFLDKRLQPIRLRERSTTFILTLELDPLF